MSAPPSGLCGVGVLSEMLLAAKHNLLIITSTHGHCHTCTMVAHSKYMDTRCSPEHFPPKLTADQGTATYIPPSHILTATSAARRMLAPASAWHEQAGQLPGLHNNGAYMPLPNHETRCPAARALRISRGSGGGARDAGVHDALHQQVGNLHHGLGQGKGVGRVAPGRALAEEDGALGVHHRLHRAGVVGAQEDGCNQQRPQHVADALRAGPAHACLECECRFWCCLCQRGGGRDRGCKCVWRRSWLQRGQGSAQAAAAEPRLCKDGCRHA